MAEIQIIYSSTACNGFGKDDFERLRDEVLQKNQQNFINGALYFCKGYFFQVLEGETDKLQNLMAEIEKDQRHFQIKILDKKNIPVRSTQQQIAAKLDTHKNNHFGTATVNENEAIYQNLNKVKQTVKPFKSYFDTP